MKLLALVIAAFILGVAAAVPAGPVQLEVVRRSINGHLKAALVVVAGAFLVDVLYGVIAFFGIAPFLRQERVMAFFWLAGGIILLVIGSLVLRHSATDHDSSRPRARLGKKRWAFIGGLSLSVTNPMMILWWLSGARIFRDLGLIDVLTPDVALIFLITGSLGLAAYLSALALFLFWAKRFISAAGLRRMNIAFGLFLLGLAIYFVVSSLRQLLPG